jgi:hypothetical protein
MLTDITTLTQYVFDQVLNSTQEINSKKHLYDTYRTFNSLISDIGLVANHYLVLDMSEEFLQNSSFGEPIDKWRWFLNKDLEKLNIVAVDYLQKLNSIAFESERMYNHSFLADKFNFKSYYGFVRDNYSVGLVDPCSSTLVITNLDAQCNDPEKRFHIDNFKKISLKTYEDKLKLQKHLLEQKGILKKYCDDIKSYILTRYSLEDLV